jgi:nitrate reductase gamma subunit
MYYLYFFLEGIFPYIALLVFFVVSIYRFWHWLKIPLPLRVNLAPSKTTWKAVTGKIAAEVLVFLSLFRTDRTFWIVIWSMHVCAVAILLGSHIFGVAAEMGIYYSWYAISFGRSLPTAIALLSFPLLASLLYVLIKRIVDKEMRQISLAADYFALILISLHVANGIYMTYFTQFDLQEGVKWGVGLATFHPYIIQNSWIFAVHCLTGFGLFLYFPFSKLFHPLGQIANRAAFTQKEEALIKGGAVVK